jgi:cytochrome P450
VLIGRPGVDADHAEMVMVVFERAEAASGGRSTPMNVTLPRGTVGFGTVLNQDVGQMHRVQRGLHQPGFTHMHLSSEEVRIITMHRTLEEFLGITPSELSGGPA